MCQEDATPPAAYRMAPGLRRSCWYVLGSLPIIVAVVLGVANFGGNRGPADFIAVFLPLALLGLAMVMFLCWKLHVDDRGVSRRVLFRPDLWSWDDFASGSITKAYPYTFVDPRRAWWRRKLRLGYLSEHDIAQVVGVINAHYRLPPPPEVPERLEIKYGFGREAIFDANGIHLLIKGWPHEYQWSDVLHVHIERTEPLRRDFRSLEIALPDQKIELQLLAHQGCTSPTWRGAAVEVINEMLLKNVREKIVEDSRLDGAPTSRICVEKELERVRKALRGLRQLTWFCVLLLGGGLLWITIGRGILEAVVMGAMCAVYPGSVLVFLLRAERKRLAELEGQLGQFTDVAGAAD